jgi:D-alanine-D-alanine ligase
MDVAILHPALPPQAALEDQDTLVQVQTVAEALVRLGHRTTTVPCTLDLAALQQRLAEVRPQVVFNLVESLGGADSLQYLPSAVLDAMGLPYTGNSTEAIFQTTHKLLAKQLLRLAGLPTPAWLTLVGNDAETRRRGDTESSDVPASPCPRVPASTPPLAPPSSPLATEQLPVVSCQKKRSAISGQRSASALVSASPRPRVPASTPPHPPHPYILKAVWEHASRGLDEQNVVSQGGVGRVRERLSEFAARTGRPAFAEQFIEGRELNLSVLAGPAGPEVLPPAEIDFSAFPPGKVRIVGYQAKWEAGSFEFAHTPRCFDFPHQDGPLLARLRELSLGCWQLFGLGGYARVDFRVDRAGQPWILEINTNPCLSPDAGFAAAVAQAAIPWDQAIGRIIEAASNWPL